MKRFKFLTKGKLQFTYEVTTQIIYRPVSLMVYENWSTQRSELIKEWLSDYFFSTNNEEFFCKIKYFPEIDRTCEILQTGIDYNQFHGQFFTAIIQLYRDYPNEYMEVHLKYPIDFINHF